MIITDSPLSFKSHIRHITLTLHSSIPSFPPKAAETLLHIFITYGLDNCNSIHYGLPSSVLQKLHVHNSAARPHAHSCSREHITPLLCHLPWISIQQHISFKLLLNIFKSLNIWHPHTRLISSIPTPPLAASAPWTPSHPCYQVRIPHCCRLSCLYIV